VNDGERERERREKNGDGLGGVGAVSWRACLWKAALLEDNEWRAAKRLDEWRHEQVDRVTVEWRRMERREGEVVEKNGEEQSKQMVNELCGLKVGRDAARSINGEVEEVEEQEHGQNDRKQWTIVEGVMKTISGGDWTGAVEPEVTNRTTKKKKKKKKKMRKMRKMRKSADPVVRETRFWHRVESRERERKRERERWMNEAGNGATIVSK
jgi:hypothetical protein